MFGNYYGTSRAAIEACLAQGSTSSSTSTGGGPPDPRTDADQVHLHPAPSREELERRLIGQPGQCRGDQGPDGESHCRNGAL